MAISTFKTVQSFVQFLWKWKLSDGKLVDQNTGNLRSAICAACHNNKPSSETRGGCGSCNKIGKTILDKVRSSIVAGMKTTHDAALKTCAICGCDLKISVWIPNQVLLKLEDSNAYPGFCWKKQIENNLEV